MAKTTVSGVATAGAVLCWIGSAAVAILPLGGVAVLIGAMVEPMAGYLMLSILVIGLPMGSLGGVLGLVGLLLASHGEHTPRGAHVAGWAAIVIGSCIGVGYLRVLLG